MYFISLFLTHAAMTAYIVIVGDSFKRILTRICEFDNVLSNEIFLPSTFKVLVQSCIKCEVQP